MIEQEIKDTLNELKTQGVDYADIRFHSTDLNEHIHIRDGLMKNYRMQSKSGYGVRVLCDGAWGFFSSEDPKLLKATAKVALEKARSASMFIQEKVLLAPKKAFKDTYSSNVGIDPFSVSLEEKIELLRKINSKLTHDSFDFVGAGASFSKRVVLFFDTEGSEIQKNILEVDPSFYAYAKDSDGLNQSRSYIMYQNSSPDSTVGYENLLDEKQFLGHPQRIKEELISVLEAPIQKEEVCSLIPMPEMMALQTHETIGHALELDRILGYELSYAGGSHVDLEHFNTLEFGSKKLNARASGITPNSPGTEGYDDDGVKGIDVQMIENGVLRNAITSRQMIIEANKKAGKEIFTESGGACRAQSYNCLPIERMNNINIDPGNDGSLEDIIAKTEDGLMVETPRSWSIGSNRENFHFACEIGWKIRDGKIDSVVRNPTYKGDSLNFWHSLDMVGDKSTWQLQQVYNCGKGQPNQVMHLAHGIPACRFDKVTVGNK
ncbi:MAG: TldD protein [Bacteriovoracaceae bacterium]|jgi:TldD protein